jgi:hypothetical protein
VQKPISKLDDDAYTLVMIILMKEDPQFVPKGEERRASPDYRAPLNADPSPYA